MRRHNSGDGTYSKIFAPWEPETYTAFKNQQAAEAFERYLKSGSGHAFLKKRLLPQSSLFDKIRQTRANFSPK
jgi:putative endonuclease